MCAARPKTTDAELAGAARLIVDRYGPDAVSMQAIADVVGVKAPSLYKRFPHKDALLDRVVIEAAAELRIELEDAIDPADPLATIAQMARAYRRYARRSPSLYGLVFARRSEGPEVLPARRRSVAPVFIALGSLVPDEDRLSAARMLTAFLHGFITLELNGAFQFGGSVDQAFEWSLATLLSGLERASPNH